MPQKPIASEDIYDALVDDESFARLPRLLADRLGGRSALIHWLYPDGGAETLAHSGWFTDDQLARYAEEYVLLDPWLRATDEGRFGNKALNLEQVVPANLYADSAFYNEFIRPMGDDTFRCLGVRVCNRWGGGIVAIHRGQGDHPFRAEAVAALQTHVPALRRMLAVRGRIAATSRRAASVEGMLDHMGQAALLVGPSGAIVHANAAGEALLWRGDALTQRNGLLSASSGSSALRLRAALGQASASFAPEASAILIDRRHGRPMVVSIMPFRGTSGSRHAMLIVEDDIAAADGMAPGLRSLYGLTRAEAEIASRISGGTSPGQIAAERGVSIETVRSQIKSLSGKLGCTRQSEIAALIKGVPVTNPGGREQADAGFATVSARNGSAG